jgi:uncharacterized protein YbjQ (UPF0145 family)
LTQWGTTLTGTRSRCRAGIRLTGRTCNAVSQLGSGVKSMFGGELRGMTKALSASRNEVMERMITEASKRGANAIVAM